MTDDNMHIVTSEWRLPAASLHGPAETQQIQHHCRVAQAVLTVPHPHSTLWHRRARLKGAPATQMHLAFAIGRPSVSLV